MDQFRVDATALSAQAKEKVLHFIRSSDLGPNGKLPREEELARIIGVSRITLRTALNELAVTGIISRQHGRGTFVNAAAANLKTSLNPAPEFVDMIRAHGYRPGVRILQTQLIDHGNEIGSQLGRPPDSPLVVTRRVFEADDRFCALCIDYFPLDVIGGSDALDDVAHHADSVFRYIAEKSGRHIVRDHVQISAVSGRDLRSEMGNRDIPTGPLLKLEGVNYDEHDTPLMLAQEFIDTSVIQFSLIRKRDVSYS